MVSIVGHKTVESCSKDHLGTGNDSANHSNDNSGHTVQAATTVSSSTHKPADRHINKHDKPSTEQIALPPKLILPMEKLSVPEIGQQATAVVQTRRSLISGTNTDFKLPAIRNAQDIPSTTGAQTNNNSSTAPQCLSSDDMVAHALVSFLHNQNGRPILAEQSNAVDGNSSASKSGKEDTESPLDSIDAPITLSLDQDEYELSPYQCLVRKQIEVFEQPENNISELETTQGRNRPIVAGQVGIRCRHCGTYEPPIRTKGAVLFPSTLLGLYQTAQNMANTHLIKLCRLIPVPTRYELIQIRSKEQGKKTRKSSYGGGRQYWANSIRVLGVVETPDKRLRFSKNIKSQTAGLSPSNTKNTTVAV